MSTADLLPIRPLAARPTGAGTTAGDGPEIGVTWDLLSRALDEVDYGVAIVRDDGRLLHMNRRAREQLHGDGALQACAGRLQARDAGDRSALFSALQDVTVRGLRRMLSLGPADGRAFAVLVPAERGSAALLTARHEVCGELPVACFARRHGLTSAEARVLTELARGATPTQIARTQGVKLSTVRTQIGSLRDKTGCKSITALVHRVATLPPMLGVLAH